MNASTTLSTIKTGLRIVAAAAAIVTGAHAMAAVPAASAATPSVVIVHGAFADGSDWAKVIPLLQAKGIHVTAVQNPLTSLADDVRGIGGGVGDHRASVGVADG